MSADLAAAWHMNVATNKMLMDALTADALTSRYSPRTRTVASQFAHMHNVRISHLERRGVEGAGGLESFPRGAEPKKRALVKALAGSDEAISRMLSQCEDAGNVKSWNGPPSTFLGYFLAHEGHHRGLILVSLRMSGVKLPKDFTYGLWYWSRKMP